MSRAICLPALPRSDNGVTRSRTPVQDWKFLPPRARRPLRTAPVAPSQPGNETTRLQSWRPAPVRRDGIPPARGRALQTPSAGAPETSRGLLHRYHRDRSTDLPDPRVSLQEVIEELLLPVGRADATARRAASSHSGHTRRGPARRYPAASRGQTRRDRPTTANMPISMWILVSVTHRFGCDAPVHWILPGVFVVWGDLQPGTLVNR